MAMIRNPVPAPPLRPGEPAIFTHPVEAAEGSSPLHDQLQAAQRVRDWRRLASVARAHLDRTGAEGVPLHAASRAAVAFLKPGACAPSEPDLHRFIEGFERAALKRYFDREHVEDRRRLADYALAHHCLGSLGAAKDDPIGALRSLHCFDRLAAAVPSGRVRIPTGLLGAILDQGPHTTVYLPAWTFEIDICGDLHLVPAGGGGEQSPFELRLEALERLRSQTTGNCDCKPPRPECTPQSVCCPELNYFIADLLELRDTNHSYVAGDLSHIVVIGAGEELSREHQFQRRREVLTESETEIRAMERRDNQVTDTGRFSREVERQTENSLSGEASVEGSYAAGPYKVSASASLSYDRSASQAIKEAQEHAREVVTNAVSELEKQVRTLRSERVTTEELEKNVHAWDNTAGTAPKVTKYFHVRKRQYARLFSYDKRLMLEMKVPSPARLYDWMMNARLEAEVTKRAGPFDLEEPKAPDALGVTADSITRENYLTRAGQHGVGDAPAPPEETVYVAASDSYGEVKNEAKGVGKLTLNVPGGYHAVRMDLTGEAKFRDPRWHNTSVGRWVRFTLGGTVWFGGGGHSLSTGLANLTGTLSIDVQAANINSCQATITIVCKLDASVFAAWQTSVFDLIKSSYDTKVTAYQAALSDYREALATHDSKKEEIRKELREKAENRDSFYNRIIEKTEIKRAIIYLMCQNFSAESAWIEMAEPCGLPELDRRATAERANDWYFWDRLFDWKYMAYAFFDYFWNPICDWPERFDPHNSDPLFKAFLGAGYARVLIPVSKAMEQDFLWYAATLQKWGPEGDSALDPSDPRWRNVLFELKHASECAMTPREGYIDTVAPGDPSVLVKDSDRYWDASAGQVDPAAVAADLDREIYIDGEVYLVAGIAPEPGSPPYTGINSMWWRLTLDRPYAGPASPRQLYAMGAQAVAPAFTFDLPSELIWAGDHDNCLPTYPLPPC